MPIDRTGAVFTAFSEHKTIQPDTLACAAAVIEALNATPPNAEPGLLLGKIQSGKTRTFITALALAFDNGFDLAIVFTKGVKVLTQQTVARITKEFEPASDRDLLHVFEIMAMQENLPPALISQKLVIVCKKEDDNIARLHRLLNQVYPGLKARRCLVVDDEADFASIGYRRDGGVVVSAVIPAQIDKLRQIMLQLSVLQVTATPYSLYLQPSVVPASTGLTQPSKPSFTELVRSGDGYVGGDVYFERSQVPNSLEELFHVTVPLSELAVIKSEDPVRFRIENCLTDGQIQYFRRAIVSFLLGGFVRRWQYQRSGATVLPKYAFIVHSETAKKSHLWQVRLTEAIRDELRTKGPADNRLRELVEVSFADLGESLKRADLEMVTLDEAITGVYSALEALMVHKVNSESQIQGLLNPVTGELNLVAHYNVFVGGNILDRGVTVPNVIGFFYGRRPNTSQQDTVLQHCRMYGYRPRADLAVTRFYTTAGIYASMRTIHEFDNALRVEIEAGNQPEGVYFLRADSQGRIRACGPQKVLASRLETIVPGRQKLLLPLGFDVRDDAAGIRSTGWIDTKLRAQFGGPDEMGPQYGELAADDVAEILEHIRRSLDFSGTDGWPVKSHIALLKYLSVYQGGGGIQICVVRGQHQPRVRDRGFQNYFVYQRVVEDAKQNLHGRPGLLLARQDPGDGFKKFPFWWPMILTPTGIHPHVFALD